MRKWEKNEKEKKRKKEKRKKEKKNDQNHRSADIRVEVGNQFVEEIAHGFAFWVALVRALAWQFYYQSQRRPTTTVYTGVLVLLHSRSLPYRQVSYF